MKATHRLALLVALLGSVAACDKKKIEEDKSALAAGLQAKAGVAQSAEGPKVEKPATLVWHESDVKLTELGATGHFNVFTLKCSVRFEKLPVGTTVTGGGSSKEVKSAYDQAMLDVDLSEAIGALSPSQALDRNFKLDPKASLELKYPGGLVQKVDLPPLSVEFGVASVLKEAADHPVAFGPEPGAAPAEHSVAWASALTPTVIGPAKRLSEVDWVALSVDSPRASQKTCSGYSGKNPTLPLAPIDKIVSIYERKTSKVITKKTFVADEACPIIAMGDTAQTFPNEEQIKQWLREQRAKK